MATETQIAHTPGPWRRAAAYRPETRDVGPSAFAPYVVDATGRNVAAALIGGVAPEEIDANARLIAAAPDLLAALKDALGTITHHPSLQGNEQALWPVAQTIDLARAAIARAEGL